MIKSHLSIAASRVIIDAVSNQVSVVDILEGIKSQSFPTVIPGITFFFYLKRSEDDLARLELTLKCSVDQLETIKFPVGVDFQKGSTTRAIIGFDGFVIPKPGTLTVALFLGENEIGSLELPVEQLDIPPPQARPATPAHSNT